MDLRVRADLTIPEAELNVRFTPSGGPGGQHANRSNTRVELTWSVESSTVLDDRTRSRLVERIGPIARVVVDDERSQTRNREIAHQRLRAKVQAALHEPKRRRPTKPSRSSQRRRVNAKKQRGELKRGRGRPSLDD